MAKNFTRRGFLGNAAIVGAGTVAAGLPLNANAAAVQGDAALFAMVGKWEAAGRTYEAAAASHAKAELAFFTARDALPALPSADLSAQTRAAIGGMTLGDVSNADHLANVALSAELAARRVSEDQRKAELDAIAISCSLDVTDRKMMVALVRSDRLARRIIAMPARTIPGLLLKLRVNEQRAVEPDELVDALTADLRTMNGEA